MGRINLRDYQLDAIKQMKNGCILCGGVGSGKSRTSLAYYYDLQGGDLLASDEVAMKNPQNLYIITTARKRDTCEWEGELAPFLLSTHKDSNYYKNTVVVDNRIFFLGGKVWSEGFKKQTITTNWQNGRSEWRPAEKAGRRSVSGVQNKGSRCRPTTAGSEKCIRR